MGGWVCGDCVGVSLVILCGCVCMWVCVGVLSMLITSFCIAYIVFMGEGRCCLSCVHVTGNTRVITQNALQTFQEEMKKVVKDPYKVCCWQCC